MVGRFTLPSLPSLPQGLADFLDTSPQVFYPPVRPASRSGASSASTSCPTSPAPRRRPRPLSMGDARILFTQSTPLPPFSPAPHPHIDSPLESSRSDRAIGLGLDLNRSEPNSPLLNQSTLGGLPRGQHQQRLGHRRSQSAAPVSPIPLGMSPPAKPRPLAELRNSISSASAASLPTLDEGAEGRPPTGRPSPSPLQEPLWVQASLRRTQTLPRGRRGAPNPLPTAAAATSPLAPPAAPVRPAMTSSRSSSSLVPIISAAPRRSNSTISFGSPRRSRTFVRHESANSVLFPEVPLSPSPVPVCASTSVSDIAALATWSEPVPQPTRHLSRSQSVTSPSASDRLRERLRSINQWESPTGASTPRHGGSPQLPGLLSPMASPRSTNATPGHGASTGPPPELRQSVSRTPTAASSRGQSPLSPTPTRRRPGYLSHKSTHSLPDALVFVPEASRLSLSTISSSPSTTTLNSSTSSTCTYVPESRPTTSRLRQPAQLSMGAEMLSPLIIPMSRCSLLEPTAPSLLSSSPGSIMSDNSSCESGTDTASPTTSVEDLCLGAEYAALEERSQSRHREANNDLPPDLLLHLPLLDNRPPSLSDLDRHYSNDARRRSRDLRELVELRESLRHSTSSLRTSTTTRPQSLRESTRTSLSESTCRTRSNRTTVQRDHHGWGTSHAHPLRASTSSYVARERRDSLAKDLIHHPTHGTRVLLSTYDLEAEDRFLDFDDI